MARCRVLCALLSVLRAPRASPRRRPRPRPRRAAAWRKPVDGDLVRAVRPAAVALRRGPSRRRLPRAARAPRYGPPGRARSRSRARSRGAVHVVVAHAGGLRTSYSFLAAASVRRGDAVARRRGARHERRNAAPTTTGRCSTSACGRATSTSIRCCCSAPSTWPASCTWPRPRRRSATRSPRNDEDCSPGSATSARASSMPPAGRRRGGRSRSRRRRDHGRTHPGAPTSRSR